MEILRRLLLPLLCCAALPAQTVEVTNGDDGPPFDYEENVAIYVDDFTPFGTIYITTDNGLTGSERRTDIQGPIELDGNGDWWGNTWIPSEEEWNGSCEFNITVDDGTSTAKEEYVLG